jgi:hypothetical protein
MRLKLLKKGYRIELIKSNFTSDFIETWYIRKFLLTRLIEVRSFANLRDALDYFEQLN